MRQLTAELSSFAERRGREIRLKKCKLAFQKQRWVSCSRVPWNMPAHAAFWIPSTSSSSVAIVRSWDVAFAFATRLSHTFVRTAWRTFHLRRPDTRKTVVPTASIVLVVSTRSLRGPPQFRLCESQRSLRMGKVRRRPHPVQNLRQCQLQRKCIICRVCPAVGLLVMLAYPIRA